MGSSIASDTVGCNLEGQSLHRFPRFVELMQNQICKVLADVIAHKIGGHVECCHASIDLIQLKRLNPCCKVVLPDRL